MYARSFDLVTGILRWQWVPSLRPTISVVDCPRVEFGTIANAVGKADHQPAERGGTVKLSRVAFCVVPLMLLTACQDDLAPTAVPVVSDELGTIAVAATFSVEDLGIPAGFTSAYGLGINNSGDVVGAAEGGGHTRHPVLWAAGSATDLGLPVGTEGDARDLNDAGTVVGFLYDAAATTVNTYGFIWAAGKFTLLTNPGSQYVLAKAINNQGTVVGHFQDPTSKLGHAFRYTASGGLVDIHPAGAYTQSLARAISERGDIAGSVGLVNGEVHAALWSSTGAFADLGTLGGPGPGSDAYGVNSAGVVVGATTTALSVKAPFRWSPTAGMVAAKERGTAWGISDLGRAVGVRDGRLSVAGTQIGNSPQVALPALVRGFSSSAQAVNRCGTIAGVATDAVGVSHPVRWNISACD